MIYFDNSATTRIAPDVLKTYNAVCQKVWGNPSSLHNLGEKAFNLLEQSRKQIASLLKVKPYEIFFTSGGTEGDNWAIKGTAIEKSFYGKHIITSSVEHAAVTNSAKQLEKMGFDVTYLPVDKNGRVSPKDLEDAIRPDTILVSIMAINNEIGTIQPINEIAEVLKKYPKIHYHVDSVQAAGKGIENLLTNDRVDMLSFSSHKFHGPRGIGFNYKKAGRTLAPLMSGGGQEKNLRSGTENLPAIAAMAKAYRLLLTDEDQKVARQRKIRDYIFREISKKEKVHVFSPIEAGFSAPHILCFAIEGVRGETVVHAFESHDIYLSTTSACSSKKDDVSGTLHSMGVDDKIAESAVRISLDENNTMEEAKQFLTVFDTLYNKFKIINS